jgi:hypothetical protein
VFDSLNMFTRLDLANSALSRSYGRYSLGKPEPSLGNHSELIDHRGNRGILNYSSTHKNKSAISNERELHRENSMRTEKDRRMEESQNLKRRQSLGNKSRDNPEYLESYQPKVSYKLEDSLSKELHDFERIRK